MGAKNPKRPEFKQVVRPSIEALAGQIAAIKGLQVGQFNPLRELSGLWVGGEFVPRPSNKPDETWTTLKFTTVYADQAACKQAADEAYSRDEADDEPDEQSAEDATRANLVAFLEAFWEQVGRDPDRLAEELPTNDLLKDHFTTESPEVLALING